MNLNNTPVMKILKITKIASLLLALTVICGQQIKSQEKDERYLTLNGVVDKGEDQPLAGAVAKLYEKGKLINTITTGSDGMFNFKVSMNSEFTFEVSKEGLVTKIFYVNTKIPDYSKGIWDRAFAVSLFQPCPGVDVSILKSPIFKLVYNERNREFITDKEYEEGMLVKLYKLMDENDKCFEDVFKNLVKKADRQYADKKYAEARDTYVEALGKRTSDENVKEKIAEIDKLLVGQKTNDKLYNDYVTQADKQFNDKNYVMAKEFYRRALAMKPGSTYPTSQMAVIEKLLAQKNTDEQNRQVQEAKYQQLMSQGTNAMFDDVCGKAMQSFNDALVVKPNDPTAAQKLAEADKKCKDIQAKAKQDQDKLAKDKQAQEAKYQQLINQGTNAMIDDNCGKAIQSFKDALAVKPNDPTATQKLAEADKKCKDIQAKAKQDQDKLAKDKQSQEARFKQLMVQGTDAMEDDVCGKAIQSFKDALAVKPNDPTATQKLAEADKKCKDILAKAKQDQDKLAKDKQAQEAKYQQLMSQGTNAMLDDVCGKAIQSFNDALTVKPNDPTATQKLAEADKKCKDIQAKAKQDQDKLAKDKQAQEARFKQLIVQGTDAMEDDVCGRAIQSFKDALAVKPNDLVATQKLAEADKKCKDIQAKASQNKEKQDKYKAAVANADKLFASSDYSKARDAYNSALVILPDEDYPKQKIKEIDNALKAKDKEKEQQYKTFVKAGDKAYDSESFAPALEQYKNALTIKPTDAYASEKVKTIESILAEQAKTEADKKAKQDLYNKAIAEADIAFKKPDYNAATTAYQKALQILPSESYPKQKLSEIDGILKDKAEKQERNYASKIQSGDKNFAAKNYAQAKLDYSDALKLKANETYPTQRIADIDKLIQDQNRLAAEQKAKTDAYNAAIAKADNLLKNNQYDQAVVAYKEASANKPDEKYPFTKIDEIGQIKKNLENEAKYKQAISTADAFFAKKQFEQSKSAYSQALALKPNDVYSTSQIAKADKEISDQMKLLANQKAKQDAFDKAMADADKAMLAKDYNSARTSYQTALVIFPDKPQPKLKIDEIDKILKEKKRNDDYNAIIDEANTLLTSKNYDLAKVKYKSASILKPEEKLPSDKIKEIDQILAQQDADKQKEALLEKNYNDAITNANNLFDKAQYDAAKKAYEQALTIMPNEAYPKQKIARINEIKSLLAKEAKSTSDSKPKPVSEKKISDLNFKTDAERQSYLKELLSKYPSGITCEVYKEKNRTITRYIIIRENLANDFREIQYNWGGHDYMRNDKPITQQYFQSQVKSREGEYFTKTEM